MASQAIRTTRTPKATIIKHISTALLSEPVHRPLQTPSPSIVAKTLTQYLFGETTLPSFLQRYGDVLVAITGGAAAATGLCWFFQRNKDNRKRIRLAVYHVVRTLQIMPDLQQRMETPNELYEEIDNEVNRMVGTYLTLSEGGATVKRAKRKLWDDYDARMRDDGAERRVRRRLDNAAAEENAGALRDRHMEDEENAEVDLTGDVPEVVVQSPSSAGQPEESPIHEEEVQQDDEPDVDVLGYNPTASHISPVRERPLPTSPDLNLNFDDFKVPPPEQSRRNHGSPSNLGFLDQYSSSPLARPSNPTPRRGRGGPYSSDDTPSPQRLKPAKRSSEEVSPSKDEQPMLRPSNPTPRRAKGSTDVDTPRPKISHGIKTELEQEDDGAYIPVISRDDDPTVPQSPRPRVTTKDIREHREKERASNAVKRAQKPRNTIPLHQPPSAMAVRTQGEVPGTWLPSIREGLSPHVSPAADTTIYRVAESRKLNKQLEGEREERRLFRKYIPEKGEVLQAVDVEQSAKEVDVEGKKGTPQSRPGKELSQLISISSGSEEDDEMVHFEEPPAPIQAASPAVNHDNPLPAAESSSPKPKPLPKAATKDQSRRSAAPSPPERPSPKAAKTPARTPAKRKALQTPGTRKSERLAKRTKGEKK
ncbi:hypothetical protein BKA58DRAFT_459709 [Alternaria rosae]|uniref:uncharacterized protein n=1 Tax=Alternaria rosae TaxID=1187941 RepID=UPI001E8E98B3|nr:uncharacterized protein BKA58DRAFT_459709 [Alternaria rosae]KAH6868757.1 hypothetical protein BKA58DRAFT_459709 [Alternaria rosae]